jgi:tungstate transport system substrate-binding protein
MAFWIRNFLLVALIVSLGCIQQTTPTGQVEDIILATTTSTYDSGLLDYLLPAFTKKHEIGVSVIPVGTGQAIELGKRGDVDVILVHSPVDEEMFISEGHGGERRCVMYNSFVILGPTDDPANVKSANVVEGLKKIAKSDSAFISRGDNSGTHKKELYLWNLTNLEIVGDWYVETGVGMGQTLLVASEKRAYTLSDEATYFSMRDGLSISVLVSGDRLLLNPYSIIIVNPEKNPNINSKEAQKLAVWLVQNEAQELISNFIKDGEQLFTPLYGSCLED